MAFISYRGQKIIPAPFISVQKQYVKSSGGTKIANHPDLASERQDNIIGAVYNIQITGTIVASMIGSPDVEGEFYELGEYPDEGQQNPRREEDRVGGSTIDYDGTPPLDKQRFNRILKMQQSLRWLFAQDGYFLEIDDGLGNEIFKCVVRQIDSVEFQEAERGENWTDRSEYSISLSTDRIESSGHPLCPLGEDITSGLNSSDPTNLPKDENDDDIYLEEATENWSVEPQEDGSDENSPYTIVVNHTISARGKRVYDGAGTVTSEAWKEAEKWVKTKAMNGSDQSITSDQQSIMTLGTTGLNLSGYLPYNRMRTENVDEMEGTYSITENFLLSKENTIEAYSVSVRTSQQTGLTTLSIEGNVRGLDDNTDDLDIYNKTVSPNLKYSNALTKYNTINQLTRAQAVATILGVTLHPLAISTNITHDKIVGTLSYSSEYNNRPTNCISGARSETINVQFSGGADVFASIAVVGRAAGPVMQDMNTVTQGKISISIDAVMPISTYGASCGDLTDDVCGKKPATTSLVESLRDEALGCHPSGTGNAAFKESDSESWNIHNGRYTRNVTYVIKTC